MQRRHFTLGLALGTLTALPGCSMTPVQTFPTLAAAQQALDALGAGAWHSSGAFSLAQILDHAAQSVEYSLDGFPQLKPALFRHTVGRAAFAVFDARGAMSHGLGEPIPGAAPLADALPAALARLQQALRRFEAHTGVLAPHFAYGALDKGQYTRAHLMHLANHWAEVSRG